MIADIEYEQKIPTEGELVELVGDEKDQDNEIEVKAEDDVYLPQVLALIKFSGSIKKEITSLMKKLDEMRQVKRFKPITSVDVENFGWALEYQSNEYWLRIDNDTTMMMTTKILVSVAY